MTTFFIWPIQRKLMNVIILVGNTALYARNQFISKLSKVCFVDYSILVYFGAISVFAAVDDGKTKAIAHSSEISMTKYVPHFVYILIIFE